MTSTDGEDNSGLACTQFTSFGFYANVNNFNSITVGTLIYETDTSSVFNGQSKWYGIATVSGAPTRALQINNVGQVLANVSCASPSPSPTPSVTRTPAVSPSSSPAALYNFSGASGTTAGGSGSTICGSAVTSPVTLKSTTNDGFGNGTLVNNSSVIYNSSNVRQDNKYVSNGNEYGQTNSSGVWSVIDICTI